jgi:hypothetical protein
VRHLPGIPIRLLMLMLTLTPSPAPLVRLAQLVAQAALVKRAIPAMQTVVAA